jgi:hypothetical protein
VIRNTSLILVLNNNGCTGIDQSSTVSRSLKMTKQKQMTEKELTQNVELSDEELGSVAGGLNSSKTSEAKIKTAPTTQITDMDSEMGFEDSGTLHIANQFTTLPIKDLF